MSPLISAKVIDHIRQATCAIGYLTVPIKDYVSDQSKPAFEVLGTGFAVRPTTVITNRHVIQLIEERLKQGIPEGRFRLHFIYEDKDALVGGLAKMQEGVPILVEIPGAAPALITPPARPLPA